MPSQSTKQLVPIADIREDILVLKNGSFRMVIEVSAINFELRSEEEQAAIIQNFQNFLNSLDFPLQIVISSRKLDLNEYLKLIASSKESLQNELLKIQASEYEKFIGELSQLANIMDKSFYVIVPFYAITTPSSVGLMESIKSLIKPSASNAARMNDQQFHGYRTQLMQRVELILDGLVGLGLKTKLLNTEELARLFYQLYNPPMEDSAKNPADNPPKNA